MSEFRIGKHKVRYGDMANLQEVDQFIGEDKADIFYSDPPWGNMKYWNSLSDKQNKGEVVHGKVLNTTEFISITLRHAIKHTEGWVVIEYGKRWSKDIVDIGISEGLFFCGIAETLYSGRNLPMNVIFFHTKKRKTLNLSAIRHTKGLDTVNKIFKLIKDKGAKVGMDLCCGMGYTAQACINNNMKFIGNELNKARLDKTIKRLEKDKNKEGQIK